jgi:outer membrane receptor protein involved in Fe transport
MINVAAQTALIKGRLIEADTREAVGVADVLLLKRSSGNIEKPVANSVPDSEGRFELAKIAVGDYLLMIKLIGYDPFTKELQLKDGEIADVGIIELKPLEIGLAEVEVVAQKKQIIYKLDRKVIEASSSLLASGGTAVDILENTPSIRVDAEGEVTFRGSSGFAVYIDGKPSVFSGTQALQQIPSGQIENIEIITTPSARNDTEGDVGIINIITKKNLRQGLSGMVNVSGNLAKTKSVDFLISNQLIHSRWYVGGNWMDRMLRSDFDQDKTTVVDADAETAQDMINNASGIVILPQPVIPVTDPPGTENEANDMTNRYRLKTRSRSNGPRVSDNFSYSIKAGYAYSLPRTELSLDLEGGYAGRWRRGDLDYSEEQTLLVADGVSWSSVVTENKTYFSRDYYNIDQTFMTITLSADHRFNDQGHKVSFLGYYKPAIDAMEYFQSDLFDGGIDKNKLGNPYNVFKEAEKNYFATEEKGLPSHFTPANAYENQHRQMGHRAYEYESKPTVRLNLDYVLPYSKTGRFEAGYQYYSYLEDGDYSMEFWEPSENAFLFRKDDAIYDNDFYFRFSINSLYAIYANVYKSFSYQIGLRGEHTYRALKTNVPGASRTYNQFHAFPSAHVGWNLPAEQQLLASYSRRITRPQLFYMEPYITYRDFYSAERGNPDIQNEFINSFEINYKKNLGNNTIASTLFHRNRTNKIERLRVPYTSAIRAGVTLDSMANVGDDYSTGIEINSQWQLRRWWNMTLNGSLYNYKVNNKLKSAGGTDETSRNYDILLSNSLAASKTTRIQVDGNFVGPSVTTQGRTEQFWYVNLSVRQQFLRSRNLTATLALRDAFNTARYNSHITTSTLESVTRIRPFYPLLSLSLSYIFNNYKTKTSQDADRDLFEGVNH